MNNLNIQGQLALDIFCFMVAIGAGENIGNELESREKIPRQGSGQAAWWQPAVLMFLKLSAWIAGPVIIALFLGKWLDKKYNSAPWLFLLCTLLAFLISMVGLIKNVLAEYRKIDRAAKTEKQEKRKGEIYH